MTKETKIAKENLKIENMNGIHYNDDCYSHRDTCQRWLEFLVHAEKVFGWNDSPLDNFIREKITDLKQAIKIYTENGI